MAAFEYIFKVPKAILSAYRVTITVTVIGTAGSLFLTSALAYVISRQDYYLAKVLSFLVLFAMLFNVGMVPTYITMVKIYNLKDTLFALIFPYLIVPWNVFSYEKFFLRETPVALIEAAKNRWGRRNSDFFQNCYAFSKTGTGNGGAIYCLYVLE